MKDVKVGIRRAVAVLVVLVIIGSIVSPAVATNTTCTACQLKNKGDLDIQEITGVQKYTLLADVINSKEFKKLSNGIDLSPSMLLRNAKIYKVIDPSGKQASFAVFPIGYEKSGDSIKLSSVVIPLTDKIRPVKYSIVISGKNVDAVEFYSLDKSGSVKLVAIAENGKISVLSDDDYWSCVYECLVQDCVPYVGTICWLCLSPPAGPCYLCALDPSKLTCGACALCLGVSLAACMLQCS